MNVVVQDCRSEYAGDGLQIYLSDLLKFGVLCMEEILPIKRRQHPSIDI